MIRLPPGNRMWALAALLQAGAFLPAARLPAAWTSARGTTSRPTGRAAVRQCAADTAPVQLWHVQLFNDDFNMREHVSRTLMMVADLSAEEANRVMQATNWNGAASVGTWEREVAEHIRQGMTQAGSRSMRRLVWPAEAADWPRLPVAGSRLPGLARVSASAAVGTAHPWATYHRDLYGTYHRAGCAKDLEAHINTPPGPSTGGAARGPRAGAPGRRCPACPVL